MIVVFPENMILLLTLGCSMASDGNTAMAFRPVFQAKETRQNKATDIIHHMNLNADPCVDFYEYACGNWQPKQTKHGTPQSEQESRINDDLIHLLEEPHHLHDTSMVRQAKEFYKICLTTGTHDSIQQQFFSEFIQQNGGFPAVPGSNWNGISYNWIQVVGKLRRYYGMDILIGFHIAYNYKNVHENSIYLGEPSTLIMPTLCRAIQAKGRDASVMDSLKHIAAAQLEAWLTLSSAKAHSLATEIIAFDYDICLGMQKVSQWDNSELYLYNRNYTRKTLGEFTQLYGQTLDFNDYVTAIYDRPIYMPVYMAAPEYFRKLQQIVSARDPTQVANYIMYRALTTLDFPFNDHLTQRSDYCLNNIKRYIPSVLGELYERQYARNESKTELNEMFSQLQTALVESLHASWIEEGTRRVGERKLTDLKLVFQTYKKSHPHPHHHNSQDYWKSLRELLDNAQKSELDRLFEENSHSDVVHSYDMHMRYRPVKKCIEVGWAVLQHPNYDERYGHAIRYATVGEALARQMVMAFDDTHWTIGFLENDSWDGLTAWRYHNRTVCFGEQVSPQLGEYIRLNSRAKHDLIGGSASLNVAFHAYIQWLGLQEPHNDFSRLSMETLPGLNYSNTQLFFIAYAQQRCHKENKTLNSSEQLTKTRARNSWTRYIVNGPLRNLVEFSREFHCAIGTPMNPFDKCGTY